MTFATSGTTGAAIATPASASAIASAAGCISAQWKGALTGSSSARFAPFALAISTARSTAALSPRHHHLPRIVVVRRLAHLPLRRLRRHRLHRRQVEPEERRHRPHPHRHRLLHRRARAACSIRAVSPSRIAPAAQSAEYSPSECPATKAADVTATPSASSARIAAIDVAISAGCAFRVSVSSACSPSQTSRDSFSPSAASTSSNTARAAG